MPSSAEQLLGETLDNGWKVIESIDKEVNSTGGHFSKCYLVEKDNGNRAFLKALDYSSALRDRDPATALKKITEAFTFERDVLLKCKNERLDHVVVAIEDGIFRRENSSDIDVVQYLIFELADSDVRRQANLNTKFDIAWSLRSLHNISVGLQQIHKNGIAHQDLKPSNVLVFERDKSKIADFGRSSYKGHLPPHEEYIIAGDKTYAPPELLYSYVDPDWNRRRLGCDFYLLGSMSVFFFLGVGVTPLIRQELQEDFVWDNWGGSYMEVLPYLDNAFQKVLELYRNSLPNVLQEDMLEIVSQLCNPNPNLRGHPRSRITNQFSLERYISRFEFLAKKAELGLMDV